MTKLCQSIVDPDNYGTTVTVTGAGGFGKTSIVTALCHHSLIKEKFSDGVVFLELGPQAIDPNMKLKGIYNLLTDKQCDANVAEEQILQLTSLHCHNLLVVIDDVWHVEGAEPIVKAFCKCKIVLTTRMNGIEQYIPTKHVVSVGPMEQSEAISLLTYGMMDVSQLSQEDVNLLDELAQDVHLWPLLLSLIKGQLSHNLKQHHSTHHEAIQVVKSKLSQNGLTAFDKNNIERSRKYAVKVCIEVTLELLSKNLSEKLKTLICYIGIGTSLLKAVLHVLWKVSEHEARNSVDVLWEYGLVLFSHIKMPPHNSIQSCVEVHAVISHYIMESIDSFEVITLSPYGYVNTHEGVCAALHQQFKNSYGVFERKPLSCLKYKKSEIENHSLPFNFNMINMNMVFDPHAMILALINISGAIASSPNIAISFPSLYEQFNTLINACDKILKDNHKLSRIFNENIQRYLNQKNYFNLIQVVETHMKQYPVGLVAQQAVDIVKKIIPFCDKDMLPFIQEQLELCQMLTSDYHEITLRIIPYIKLSVKELQQINSSLLGGPDDIKINDQYYTSGKCKEDYAMVKVNYLIKVQEVAPSYVYKQLANFK